MFKKFLILALVCLFPDVATARELQINACWPASTTISCLLPIAGTSGGTGVSSTATYPTSGIIVTEAGTETLTNKTLTSPIITGGSIDNTPIGATTASTGSFTTGLFTTGATTAVEISQPGGSGQLKLTRTTNSTGSVWLGSADGGFRIGTVAGGQDIATATAASGWTLGSTTSTGPHLFQNKSTTVSPITVQNNDTTTGSDGLASVTIVKGSSTTTSGTGGNLFVKFYVAAGVTASGVIATAGANNANFFAVSDARLKENIKPMEPQLHKILAMKPSTYVYKKGIKGVASGPGTGFIAQELEKVYPESVMTATDGWKYVGGWTKETAYLVKAIQELNEKFEAYRRTHP